MPHSRQLTHGKLHKGHCLNNTGGTFIEPNPTGVRSYFNRTDVTVQHLGATASSQEQF